jgi:uncharacterized membrane protein
MWSRPAHKSTALRTDSSGFSYFTTATLYFFIPIPRYKSFGSSLTGSKVQRLLAACCWLLASGTGERVLNKKLLRLCGFA